MGFTQTYHYQVQVEIPGTQQLTMQGAMSYKEALSVMTQEAKRLGATTGYVWPQTMKAKRQFGYPSVCAADYKKVTLDPSGRVTQVNIERIVNPFANK